MRPRTNFLRDIEILDSTNVHFLRYDPKSEVLEVQFRRHDGKQADRYRYYDLDSETFAYMLTAPSVGKYFNDNIRGEFTRRKFATK